MSAFIDEHRGRFGVEPICSVLDLSASAYYRRATGQRSERVIEDERLLGVIGDLHAATYYACLHEALDDRPPAEVEALDASKYVPTPFSTNERGTTKPGLRRTQPGSETPVPAGCRRPFVCV